MPFVHENSSFSSLDATIKNLELLAREEERSDDAKYQEQIAHLEEKLKSTSEKVVLLDSRLQEKLEALAAIESILKASREENDSLRQQISAASLENERLSQRVEQLQESLKLVQPPAKKTGQKDTEIHRPGRTIGDSSDLVSFLNSAEELRTKIKTPGSHTAASTASSLKSVAIVAREIVKKFELLEEKFPPEIAAESSHYRNLVESQIADLAGALTQGVPSENILAQLRTLCNYVSKLSSCDSLGRCGSSPGASNAQTFEVCFHAG